MMNDERGIVMNGERRTRNAARARRSHSSFILHPSALKTGGIDPPARSGFTLTELLVSLVILVGMMTLVATIFSTAGRSSGTAQAQSRLHRLLLQAADTIRNDLANTLPGTDAATGSPMGVLAIAGVSVNARDTLKTPIRSHRADVLMLLTQQRFEPFIYRTPANAAYATVFEDYKQVVYGHADIGKLDAINNVWFPGSIRHVEGSEALGTLGTSAMLASEWHLARRVVGFVSNAASLAGIAQWSTATPAAPASAAILGADPVSITDAVYPPIGPILNQTMPGWYVYTRGASGAMTPGPFYFEDGAGNRFYWDGASFYRLAADPAGQPAFWWRLTGSSGSPPLITTSWERTYQTPPNLTSTLVLPHWPPLPFGGYYMPGLPANNNLFRFWPDWFYAPYRATGASDSYRTRIDPMPPAGMPERTSACFLPSCSEFKVEFTYDDPREIAVNPGPGAGTGQPFGADINGDGAPDVPAAFPINWQTVPPGQIFVWTGLPTQPNVYPPVGGVDDLRNLTFPYRWPRALRITIRAYAPGGALEYPVEQTIVHVW